MLTPFMGVGSEVYGAVKAGRRAVGIELKPSYFRQSLRNLESVDDDRAEQDTLFPLLGETQRHSKALGV